MIGLDVGDVGAFWPTMWVVLRVMFFSLVAVPVLALPVTAYLRRRAYGPGGGRR